MFASQNVRDERESAARSRLSLSTRVLHNQWHVVMYRCDERCVKWAQSASTLFAR